MVRFVIRAANEPAKRFRLLWYFVGWCIAGIYLIVGGGYLAAGKGATNSSALLEVVRVERNYHIHGALMVLIGALLIYGLSDYRRATRRALFAVFLYSLWVAILIIGGWHQAGVTWAGPFWYLFVAVLSGGLIVLAPPLNPSGRRWGTEGSGSA